MWRVRRSRLKRSRGRPQAQGTRARDPVHKRDSRLGFLGHAPHLLRNAQTGEYGDLVKQGVIDPAKVVRTALQDAASVAGLLVTTEAMVAEKPKPKTSPAMPPGGGMGDMDY